MSKKRLKLKGSVGERSPNVIKYHGRSGHPVIHKNKEGRRYIMVRAKGGGVKRLYEGSLYKEER